MLTPKGNYSAKIRPGYTFKRHLKMEKIARLSALLPDAQIALILGCTVVRIRQIKATPEYVAKVTEIQTGIVSDLDHHLRTDTENFAAEVKEMMPEALLALRDTLQDKSNPRLRLEAAKQVLDREGTTAIISKTKVTQVHEFDFSQNTAIADDLLSALQAVQKEGDIQSAEIPGASVFKNSSLNKEEQQKMYETININDFDIPKSARVN
jgi:hypothetical protein